MNPGLVVKLRPAGPWRIGPDSGARNRVDVIYHSDSLYSAVTSAMSRMGMLDAWLDATARSQAPAVCFSSCFPFTIDAAFVVPPRTLWPPTSPAAMSARVRWKSARFIPLTMVESILSGRKLNENQWSVDGASGCLMPVGKPGPFRTSVRWNAAVDRLSGASERHATACIEFREGCGLWTVVGFRDEAARDAWQEQVKAAFRLLADTGFGGERSRGWGRAETPEFVAGTLPGLIIEYKPKAQSPAPVEEPETEDAPPVTEPPVDDPDSAPVPPIEEGAAPELASIAAELDATLAAEAVVPAAEPEAATVEPDVETNPIPAAEPEAVVAGPDVETNPIPAAEPALSDAPVEAAKPIEAAVIAPRPTTPMRVAPEPEPFIPAPIPSNLTAHWLLSLFTPAAEDAVDWGRGNYAVLARGGRIESPSLGSGELKKQIQMVTEGSVLYSDGVPMGAASDVAPDGFAHPVFRAGFALAIPLPKVH
ncbi:MAG: hypothetical protein ABI806_27570 [Candidatus Solibacter sp.]